MVGVLNVSIIDNAKSYRDAVNKGDQMPGKPRYARHGQHNPNCQEDLSVPFNKAKSPPIKLLLENALKKKGWTDKDLINPENPNGQLPMNNDVNYMQGISNK